jgi:sporulation protein YlmC with PRC-barrel domain
MFKRFATFTLTLPLVAGGMCFADDKMPTKTETRTETTVRDNRTDEMGGQHARISKFIHKDVHNQDGKDIGDVKDVVLDSNTNRVSYVVVSYGGFMGMGDKLFAIPWSAFDFRYDKNADMTKEKDRDDYKLYLTGITDENLKNAPGFDDKHWPDMADQNFRTQVDTYYREHRTAADAKGGVDTRMNDMPDKMTHNTGNDGTAAKMGDKMAKTGPSDSKGLLWCRRASKIIGADVNNKANEDVGDIKDLVVNTRTGHVSYAVLAYGGVLGMGDKLFAVPMDSLATKADDDKFVLDVTKDQLKNAPGFDKNNWPDFASADFRKGVDEYYNRDRQREAKTPMD